MTTYPLRHFSPPVQRLAEVTYTRSITEEEWQLKGARVGGTFNGAYPVENADGVRAFRKGLSNNPEYPSPRHRMAAENIAARLAYSLDLPVPPNLVATNDETDPDYYSLISLEPFPDSVSLDRRDPNGFTRTEQMHFFNLSSALYPFYLWLRMGDLNEGCVLTGKPETPSSGMMAVIDFEDCGIARWLDFHQKGLKPDLLDCNRELSVDRFMALRKKFCRDIGLAGKDVYASEFLHESLKAIEAIPEFILRDIVELTPSILLRDEEKPFILEALDSRRETLRPMLMRGLGVKDFQGVRQQAPVDVVPDEAVPRLFDPDGEDEAHRVFAVKNDFRAAALEIAQNLSQKEFRAAAKTFCSVQKQTCVKAREVGKLHLLYELLEEQDVMAFPYRWDVNGQANAVALVYPDAESPLKGMLPYTEYKVTTVDFSKGPFWKKGEVETQTHIDEDGELGSAIVLGYLEPGLRFPGFGSQKKAYQESQIPHLKNQMRAIL
jgi:hypothetical protein